MLMWDAGPGSGGGCRHANLQAAPYHSRFGMASATDMWARQFSIAMPPFTCKVAPVT